VVLGLATTVAAAAVPTGYTYVSPVPGSRYVSPGNTIALRTVAGAASISPGAIEVQGAASGPCAGSLRISDDGRTVFFVPAAPFRAGERVTVRVNPAHAEGGLPPLTFDFTVSTAAHRPSIDLSEEDSDPASSPTPREYSPLSSQAIGEPLPSSYPPIVLHIVKPGDPGNVFMTPNPPGNGVYGNLVILDRLGQPLFYRRNPTRPSDSRMQPNGLLTYFDAGTERYLAMDESFTVVDTFAMGNGYTTDSHDFRILDNGHVLLMSYDPQPVRMDSVVAGGDSNAVVTGLVIQELDAAKNVVFQWRSWDHFQITDAVPCVVNLLASSVDYVHGNAIDLDQDGNLILSCRHMNEITKIDRSTGDVIWRFGLNAVNNQFTVFGDTRGFSHQHDVRRLPNGNLSLFDNGNCLSPQYSRALEFSLDEVNRTATLVWEYRNNPDIFGRATGNNQRRAGGTMINWGFGDVVTDLAPDGSKTFEVTFGQMNMRTYRALRQAWTSYNFTLGASALTFGPTEVYDRVTLPLNVQNLTAQPIEIDYFVSSDSLEFRVLDPMPLVLGPGAVHEVEVEFRPVRLGLRTALLYARAINDTQLVAQSVEVRGTGTGATAVEETQIQPALAVSPSPARGAARIRFATSSDAHVRLEVVDIQGRVVAVLADERLPAGSHERSWAPRTEHPPGLHFVRWSDGRETRSAKLVRIR